MYINRTVWPTDRRTGSTGIEMWSKWFDYFISTVFFRNVSEEDSDHLSQHNFLKAEAETNGRYPPHSRFGRRLLIWNNQITWLHISIHTSCGVLVGGLLRRDKRQTMSWWCKTTVHAGVIWDIIGGQDWELGDNAEHRASGPGCHVFSITLIQ